MRDIDEIFYQGKPDLEWIQGYTKSDGTFTEGHWRTKANETIADNLNTDVDRDGIPGWFDSDADGDEILESVDIDGHGIADAIANLFSF